MSSRSPACARVGIHLDEGLDWGVIAGLLREGYLEIAPKKLRDIR